jgi:Protein of unknown function (DUF2867)
MRWIVTVPAALRRRGSIAFDVRTLPPTFTGAREGMLIDRRERIANATPQQVAAVFTQLGGTHGWLYGNALWEVRGLLDRAIGGIGLRRGRRSPTDLRVGDAVDFWRSTLWSPTTFFGCGRDEAPGRSVARVRRGPAE